MRVVIFGATGMVGHGALRACLLDDTVTEVLTVVRTPVPLTHPKLRQTVHTDFTNYTAIQDQLKDLDACFFCLGVSAVGHKEREHTRITHDYTLAAARVLHTASPSLTFVYVSGEGTDPTGTSRQMWARVKGRPENELLAMPMTAYMFRPGYIQPTNGATSRTPLYRILHRATGALYPLLRRTFPRYVTDTDAVGQAMLAVTRQNGTGPAVVRNTRINHLASV
ncbi:NAD-dependent epimerase/dehydratase family protein [Streptomyces koyangensis]